MKKFSPYAFLSLLYGALVIWVVPKGCVFGSQTDWLSQHVALAETIRTACLSQHTLLPDWIGLGSGANGFQFAYYGFLRPGCAGGVSLVGDLNDDDFLRLHASFWMAQCAFVLSVA